MATYGHEGGHAFNEDQRGGHTEENREIGVNYEQALGQLRGGLKRLENAERNLGEIRATLYANFVERETWGVRLSDGEASSDMTDSRFLELVLRKICNRIEGLQEEAQDRKPAAESCDHSHTFKTDVDRATWYYKGEKKGEHESIQLVGCYKCGKVWCRDYAA